VVDDIGRAAADRLVKFHESVGNRSRDTFIFPRTTHQVVVFVVEGREYVVTIFVGFNAAPVEVKCLSHRALVIEAANRHVVQRAFSFDIAGDSSAVNDWRTLIRGKNAKNTIGRLTTVGQVAAKLGRLYRHARWGVIPVTDASRLATILAAMRQCLETSELERRIAEMEAAISPVNTNPSSVLPFRKGMR
jgi:hypothetical protein